MKNNNNKEYIKWKQNRKTRKAVAIASLATVAAGVGVGAGYAIWHKNDKSVDAPAISANHTGYLQMNDVNQRVTITITGYNGASDTITDVTGEPITNGNLTRTFSGNTAIISLGINAVAKTNYTIIISNGTQTAMVNLTVSPATVPSTYNYVPYSQVKSYFTTSGTTITGFVDDSVGDSGLNDYMKTHGFNGIDFGNDITTIGDYVFERCASMSQSTGTIIAVKFANLISVGREAFYSCYGLQNITLVGNNDITIGPKAFQSCGNLQDFIYGEGDVDIREYAFYNCANLHSVVLGNGDISIGNSAFQKCLRLEKISVGDRAKITDIGSSAFSDCFWLDNLNKIGITNGNLNGIGIWVGTNQNAYLKNNTNSGCVGSLAFGNIDISGLTTIGNNAFANCSNLTGITAWPADISVIGESAFQNCTNLTTVTLPNTIMNIGISAFEECTKLISWGFATGRIDTDGIQILSNAFKNCSQLATINLSDTGNMSGTVEANAFAWIPNTGTITGTINPNNLAVTIIHIIDSPNWKYYHP